MKKMRLLCLSMGILLACSTTAFADGNAFAPLNFDDVSYSPNQTVQKNPSKQAPVDTSISPDSQSIQYDSTDIKPTTKTDSDFVESTSGNTNMQNAILQLDNAQVEVRNNLLNYKTKYSEIDNQYQQIKAERQAMQKLVKSTEKRIRQLDRAKANIRKNMI